MKYLYGDNYCLGYIGQQTRNPNYKVGDIVIYCYKLFVDIKYDIGIIVKNPNKSGYGVYGWCGEDMSKNDYHIEKVVIPSELVTENILRYIKEIEVKDICEKEMTLDEVEEILGYKIKIVGSKNSNKTKI